MGVVVAAPEREACLDRRVLITTPITKLQGVLRR